MHAGVSTRTLAKLGRGREEGDQVDTILEADRLRPEFKPGK